MVRVADIPVRIEGMDEFTAALRDTKALIAEVERLAPMRPEVRDAVVLNSVAPLTLLAARLVETVEADRPPRLVEVEVEVECDHDDCSCQCDCCDNCKWCS